MDALRASTMLLLVPAHAAGLIAVNGSEGAWSTMVIWGIHVFRLPLFFAMSGFFLALMLSRRGLGGTARNRTTRIVVPLAVGMVTVMPLYLATSQLTGLAISDTHLPPEGSPFGLRLGFLWFLWDLLIIDAVAVALYLLAPRLLRRAGYAMRGALARPLFGIGMLATLTAVLLWPHEEWMAPASLAWIPEPVTLAYYALFAALGATLHTHREQLVTAAHRNAWRWLACALLAAVPAAALFALHNSSYASSVHAPALFVYAVATWASLLALVGLATRYLSRPRPRFRYMADASYWIYLSHLPAMVLAVALFGSVVGLSTAPLFAVAVAVSLAFSLVTYDLFVRYTAVGRVLNGPRERPAHSLSRGRIAPSLVSVSASSASGSEPSTTPTPT